MTTLSIWPCACSFLLSVSCTGVMWYARKDASPYNQLYQCNWQCHHWNTLYLLKILPQCKLSQASKNSLMENYHLICWFLICWYLASGLGWVAVGTGGVAHLKVWTYAGVSITKRDAMIPLYSRTMEKPGLGNKFIQPPKAAKRSARTERQTPSKAEVAA